MKWKMTSSVGSTLYNRAHLQYKMTPRPSLPISTIKETLRTLGDSGDINNLSKNDSVTFILNQFIQRTAENEAQNGQEARAIMHRRENRTKIKLVTHLSTKFLRDLGGWFTCVLPT